MDKYAAKGAYCALPWAKSSPQSSNTHCRKECPCPKVEVPQEKRRPVPGNSERQVGKQRRPESGEKQPGKRPLPESCKLALPRLRSSLLLNRRPPASADHRSWHRPAGGCRSDLVGVTDKLVRRLRVSRLGPHRFRDSSRRGGKPKPEITSSSGSRLVSFVTRLSQPGTVIASFVFSEDDGAHCHPVSGLRGVLA